LKSQEDIDRSTGICLRYLPVILDDYDAFLLACYADHPLLPLLQAKVGQKPVIGIFEASIQAALDVLPAEKRFAVLTTGRAFERQLQDGVVRLLGPSRVNHCFAGVVASDIGMDDFADEVEETAKAKVKTAVKKIVDKDDIGVVCIGGVILYRIPIWVREACEEMLGNRAGREVIIIDQFKAGAAMVERAMHRN